MKQLAILSGKGGTGKTSIAAAFAVLAKRSVTVDADVDAANLHLLLNPEVRETGEHEGGKKAVIDPARCTHCDICRPACRFDAISTSHEVEPLACEGCGLCTRLCPEQAATMEPTVSGRWFVSDTRAGTLVHARLAVAAENSGRLVTLLRRKAVELAGELQAELIVIDGSPGIGCPVIASLTGCDLALAVTEPSLSGLHDLQRVKALADHFAIPFVVTINKADLNREMSGKIADYCEVQRVPLLVSIPFDRRAVAALVEGRTLVEYDAGPVSPAVVELWQQVQARLAALDEPIPTTMEKDDDK